MSAHIQEPCFLCEQLVSIHDLTHIFIPGEIFHWADYSSTEKDSHGRPLVFFKGGMQRTHIGAFKVCEFCQTKQHYTDHIRKKIGFKPENDV